MIYEKHSTSGTFSSDGVIEAIAAATKKRFIIRKVIISINATVTAADFKLQSGTTDILENQYMVGPDKWSEDLDLRCNEAEAFNISVGTLTGSSQAGSYYVEYEISSAR